MIFLSFKLITDVIVIQQGQELKVDSLRSVFSIVYHVSRLIYSMQSEFINSALQHIIPYHMSDESDVRLHAQVSLD